MSDPDLTEVQSIRAELRLRRQKAMMPRLWDLMRDQWQRVQDRASLATAPVLCAAWPADRQDR